MVKTMNTNNQEFKDITLDELARMVARGFAETATKAEMNQRFDAVDARLDAVESDLAIVKSDVASLTDEMAKRPTREELLQEVQKLNYGVELNDLRTRLERVEEKLGLKH